MNELQKRKAQRLQLALSIYELAVSSFNGWGIKQDKEYVLRGFKIVEEWGDADALAEVGFYYTQCISCMKDSEKAAKYYRMAEAKGISMLGSSWYIFEV